VSLQRAYFDPLRLSVIGDTRVTNFFYEKKVSAVCTWNNWDKKFEVHAEFNGTHDATDIFTFELPVCCSHYSTMQFVIRYITGVRCSGTIIRETIMWYGSNSPPLQLQISRLKRNQVRQMVTNALEWSLHSIAMWNYSFVADAGNMTHLIDFFPASVK